MYDSMIGFPVTTTILFVLLVVTGLAVDFYSHKNDEVVSLKSAINWSIFWILTAVIFGIYLFFVHGSTTSSLFFTGYILEKMLSIDNLFVFIAIFKWLSIPENQRHRVLYYGIIGAIVFRLIFVLFGTSLLNESAEYNKYLGMIVELIFGAVVVYSGYLVFKAAKKDEEELEDYSEHYAYKLTHKFFPVSSMLHGNSFFHKNIVDGITYATPLFLCLVLIEVSDVMFAFDSVPAVIAVSKDPLIVYASMIFAILGLRTMYFLLEAGQKYLKYLETAIIGILFFIGGKLIINSIDHTFDIGVNIPDYISIIVVMTALMASIIASFIDIKISKKVDK